MMDVKALSGRVRVLHDVQENNIGNNQEKDMGYLDF
jgi:hypothetical protein